MKSDMEKFEEAEAQAAKDHRPAEVVALAEKVFLVGVGMPSVKTSWEDLAEKAFEIAGAFQQVKERKANGEI